MKSTQSSDERIARMVFADIYPLYIAKVEKKGRTPDELHKILSWLTGFTDEDLKSVINNRLTFEEVFEKANLHPDASLIKGVICGYRVEEIENPLTQKARYMDKLVDELAKGRKMEKILRSR